MEVRKESTVAGRWDPSEGMQANGSGERLELEFMAANSVCVCMQVRDGGTF